MLKIYDSPCHNCLYTSDRIVSPKRAKEIIRTCKDKQDYFVCHKASMNNETIVCANYFKRHGEYSQMIRIAHRLGATQFVSQTDTQKLPTYEETK